MIEFSHGPVIGQTIAAILIFAASYVLILIEKWDRSYTALGGALLMLLIGIVPVGEAFTTYLHGETILLIVGLFICTGVFQKTGVMQYAALLLIRKTGVKPLPILLVVTVLVAVCSAMLDSLAVIAIFVPLILQFSKLLKLTPVPFLIAAIFSAHIGGAATLAGSIPSRMIGTAAGFTFNRFILTLGPLAIILLLILIGIIWGIYGRRMIVSSENKTKLLQMAPSAFLAERFFWVSGSAIAVLMLLAFILHGVLGWSPAVIAVVGAVLLLAADYRSVAGAVRSKDVHGMLQRLLDSQLIYFIGLFVMVGGLTHAGLSGFAAARLLEIGQGSIPFLSILLLGLTGIGSAMLDPIPYIAAVIPVIQQSGELLQNAGGGTISPLWWSLIMGVAVGSCGTLIGSTVNMLAAGIASQEGSGLTHTGYMKVAVPVAVLMLAVTTVYFSLFLL